MEEHVKKVIDHKWLEQINYWFFVGEWFITKLVREQPL